MEKAPSDSALRSTELVMPDQATPEGFLRAGVLMEWVDYIAGMVAIRHCRGTTVTRYMDRMVFNQPLGVGNAVHMYSRVTWVGRTSMEVTVDICRENLRTGEQVLANTARLVFVALGADMRPLPEPIPRLRFETEEQQHAFAAAGARRQARRAPPPDEFEWEPQVVRTELVYPKHMNPHNVLSGGVLMGWMDFTAHLCARQHARAAIAPKSVDDLNFDLPIRPGDAVHLSAAVTWTGRTSCEVAVQVVREPLLTGVRERTHTAYFTYVAVDEHLRPTAIKPFVPQTPEEAARQVRAAERHRQRKGAP